MTLKTRNPNFAEIKQYVAETIRVCVSRQVDMRYVVANKADIFVRLDEASQDLVLTLDYYIHAMEQERVVVNERWPIDWWEAVKDRWAPAWFLRRWPVKWMSVNIDKQIYGPVCPHIVSDRPQKHLEWVVGNASW